MNLYNRPLELFEEATAGLATGVDSARPLPLSSN